MGKGRNVKTYTMNRQTKQYAMNAKRQALKVAGVKEPKSRVDAKKMAKDVKVAGIVLLAITIVATIIWGWWGLLGGFVLTLLAAGAYLIYLKKVDADWIRYYKAMEMPKEQFMKMTAAKANAKQRARISKRWDKIQVKK